MITKKLIPVSEYTDEIIEKNGIYYKYLYPVEQDDNMYLVCEISFLKEPTEQDIQNEIDYNIQLFKQINTAQIKNYDVSNKVNGFILNNEYCWLDKATRVGLRNSITVEKEAGRTVTTVYFNNNAVVLDINTALSILSQIELYAIECYKVTEQHLINVQNLNSLESLAYYDYTTDYPEQLSFEV